MKTTAFDWKYLKYLFWLGPILVVMGVTAGIVANSWGAVPLGLVVAGIAVSLTWLVREGTMQGFFGRRSTQAGTNALISALAVVVILGLVNFLAVRYVSRVDLTENQIFTLASQSQMVVRDLRQPVKLWIFDRSPNPIDRDLLENYRRENTQFSYEYVDPQAQPGIARDFKVGAVGEVYVEAGEKRQFIQAINAQERLNERRITNGLAQVVSDRQNKIYFLQGHGERPLQAGQGGLSQMVERMGQESYLTQPLNLTETPAVPDDASVVVIAGPQRALLASEVTVLNDYLQRRSGLMVLIDPQTKPDLGNLLDQWGVQFGDRLLLDPSRQGFNVNEAAITIVSQYGQHPITQGLGNGISLYPVARPLELKPVDGVKQEPLLGTNNQVRAYRIDDKGQLQFDPTKDLQGSQTLGVALSRAVAESKPESPAAPEPDASPDSESPSPTPTSSPSPDDEQKSPPEARLVAIGNSSFIMDGFFDQQLNGDVFLNAISWLSQRDDQVLAIRPKEMTNRRIFMQPQQQIVVALIALVFLPILGFGMGIGIWWRRR